MTVEEYIAIRDDQTRDTMPVLHFYYNLCSPVKLNYENFSYAMSMWLFDRAGFNLGSIHYHVFKELNKYFNLN